VPAAAPLALVASRVRYEEKRLLEAAERRRVPCLQVDPRTVWMELTVADRPHPGGSGGPPGWSPGWSGVALNREVSHTRGLYLARLLEAKGVPTVNPAAVAEVCGDKLLTSLALERAGLPTPRTALALTSAAALEAAEVLGYPVVTKPLVGSWGRLAAVLRDREAAEAVLEHRDALPSPQQHVVYLQELIDKPGRDLRAIVVGDRVLGACYRRADGWRTNGARGASFTPCPPDPALDRLALAAAAAVGGGVLGVDLLEDRDGALQVLEVNHTVEFRGFQEAVGDRVDVAGAIVGHALAGAGR
jgi:[lysine-biosynthesis-protein LysW]--L-2-aminoadipate ligase